MTILFFSNSKNYKFDKTELDRYVEEGVCDRHVNPLDYQKVNSNRYPNLTKLAKKYLAVPATSGGVERVFSIAGALKRARRVRLTPENTKNLILFRDFLCC